MPPDAALSDLVHTIQLSVAPVFLLSGVGTLMGVMANRLARIVDRTRALEARHVVDGRVAEEGVRAELRNLSTRRRLINRAIGLCTSCAVLVASIIAGLFLGAIAGLDVTVPVAVAFVAAMLALIAGLLTFLREVQLGIRWMRQSLPPI